MTTPIRLWRHREEQPAAAEGERPAATHDGERDALRRRHVRRSISIIITALALLVVWIALVAPDRPTRLTPEAFLRIPIEGIVVVALALVLPRRACTVLAWVVGPLLGLVVVVKILDVGFFTAFDRPFNPFDDWRLASDGIGTLRASIGNTEGDLVLGGLAILAVAALALPTLAVLRMTRTAAGDRRMSGRIVGVLAILWVLCWATGVRLISGVPIASTSAAGLAVQEVRDVRNGFLDEPRFAAEIRNDPFASTPGDRLLTGLRGKDVLLVFVESYGQVAVQGSSFSPGVDNELASGMRQLSSRGFAARSGWLTSPTFGGISWLVHSTMQSGLWVDTQARYDQLMASKRLTLTEAFDRAGWRTVADSPADNEAWPDGGRFYHFDKIYNRFQVNYHGPGYGYATMPDQYVLAALQRLELGRRHRPPLFAEVDLVSSHEPWTQIPPLLPWSRIGDGVTYWDQPTIKTSIRYTPEAFGRSIQYSLQALFSFITRYGRKNLVMIVLGDEQPGHIVSRYGVSHDVPISIIAHDPAVFRRIAGWRWVNGMRPTPHAPVWQMSAFRNRFLHAFGPRAASRAS
jgi:hypothetical protein